MIEVYGVKRALEIWQKRMQNNDLPTHALTRQMRFRLRKLKLITKPKPLPKDKTRQSTFETGVIRGLVKLYLRYRVTAVSVNDF